ncbi:thioesterase II family protein [Paraburkholderia phenazinium]|jgi:surfactin synthase thioesterase subunit|uniref:Surfactin synthase thioesterase subunit n=1 Tax=Paraburkholderia phenazinium TaxID=60549 RepID=A0A1N6JJE7_9BURK|nr:alpha/beta fold hydrolase [Paraburkholderia phenazinium]SIO44363.1 Surfactin synthase thioesterase subunit [Paraburkholderia phenazinium]
MTGSVAVPAVPIALQPVRLFCLPHAGGNAMLYRRWAQRLPRGVQVEPLELPGHGARRALPAHTEWPALVDALLVDLEGRLDGEMPFAVFGHSMGALVGLELIHALRERHGLAPVWFGASGSVAPRRRKRETHWLDCTHDAMVDRLRELGGTPAELLEDRDFIDFVLPLLRADFHLCGTYRRELNDEAGIAQTSPRLTVRSPLDCPVDVFMGRDDSATACVEDVAAWREETRATCVLHRFDGGHFYLDGAPEPVLARVATSLADALAQSAHAAPARLSKAEAWIH